MDYSPARSSRPRPGFTVPAEHCLRRDRIDSGGTVTPGYQSTLLHLGVGRRFDHTRVLLLVTDRDVRVPFLTAQRHP